MDRNGIPVIGIIGERHEVIRDNGELFDANILNDISCKHFKATTFGLEPIITVKELEDGTLKWVKY